MHYAYLPSAGRKPYVGDFHKTKMFRRSEKPYFAIDVTALSYFEKKTYHHAQDEEPDLMSMLWYHFIWNLRRYLGKMFFLVNLCTPGCMHRPGKKPYVDKKLYHIITANVLVRKKAVYRVTIYLTLQTKSRMSSFHSSIYQAKGRKWILHAFSKP